MKQYWSCDTNLLTLKIHEIGPLRPLLYKSLAVPPMTDSEKLGSPWFTTYEKVGGPVKNMGGPIKLLYTIIYEILKSCQKYIFPWNWQSVCHEHTYILTYFGPIWGPKRNLAQRDHFSHTPESMHNMLVNRVSWSYIKNFLRKWHEKLKKTLSDMSNLLPVISISSQPLCYGMHCCNSLEPTQPSDAIWQIDLGQHWIR